MTGVVEDDSPRRQPGRAGGRSGDFGVPVQT
jgi:hypothetical protein